MIFRKNHFKVHKWWFHHRNVHSFWKFDPFQWMAMPANLANFSKNSNKVKENSKKSILWHGILLCPLVAIKNDKPKICQSLQKLHHKKAYHLWTWMGFKAKWPSYGHSERIVCDLVPLFGQWLYLGMGKQCFQLGFSN